MEPVKKKNINVENIPFQVTDIINKLLVGPDKEHIKENYRVRLIDIRDAIDATLMEYDDMLKSQDFFRNSRKKKK